MDHKCRILTISIKTLHSRLNFSIIIDCLPFHTAFECIPITNQILATDYTCWEEEQTFVSMVFVLLVSLRGLPSDIMMFPSDMTISLAVIPAEKLTRRITSMIFILLLPVIRAFRLLLPQASTLHYLLVNTWLFAVVSS